MSKKLYQLALIFFLSAAHTLSGEYIVYKKSQSGQIEQLSREEYAEKAYPVLLKYQWPTSIMFFHEKPQQDELWKYTHQGKRHEQQYISKKLKNIDSSYEIAFVPDLIYELFIMEMNFTISYESQNIHAALDALKYAMIGGMDRENDYEKILELFNKELYSKTFVKNAKQRINYELIAYLTRQTFYQHHKGKSLASIIRAYKYIIANDLLVELACARRRVELLPEPTMLKRLIDLEYEAHDKNTALIYRGISSIKPVGFGKVVLTPFELPYLLMDYFKAKPMADFKMEALYQFLEKQKKEGLDEIDEWRLKLLQDELEQTAQCTFNLKEPARSISYGNNFFAGYYHDKSACIYYYLMEPQEIKKLKEEEVGLEAKRTIEESEFEDSFGYVLFINKWQYAKNHLRDIIRIPPIDPLVGLYAHGEFFHPRTPAYYHGKPGDRICLPGFNNSFSFVDYPGYIVSYSDQLKGAKKLAGYLSRNSRIIKLFEVEGAYNLKPKRVSQYMKNQKKLLSILTILKFTYNQCLKRRERTVAQVLESLVYQVEELQRRRESQHVQAES